jgi:hypothetical protein
VARDLSLRQLETRFGVPYPQREPSERARERERERLSPAVQQVVNAVEEHERVAGLKAEGARADQELATARRQLERLDRALERVEHASQRFESALTRVYREPAAARARFERATAELGTNQVATLLEAEPERFGALKTVERRRALGLGIAHDDRQARAAAPRAAFLAREFDEAEQALGTLVGQRVDRARRQPEVTETKGEGWLEATRNEAVAVVNRATDRLRRMQQELKHAPSLGLLERSLGRAVDRLKPREIAQLRRVLTPPRAAIAFAVREVVKDIVLGREEDDER